MTTSHQAILSNGKLILTPELDPHKALATLTALAEADSSEVTTLARVTTDEWGASIVQQIALPLPSPQSAPAALLTPAARAWLAQHDQQVAHAAWNRGYSHSHWQERGYADGRDHIPTHLADQLEHWNPYPIPDNSDPTAAELHDKDHRP